MRRKLVKLVLFLVLGLMVTSTAYATGGGPGNPDPKGQLIKLQILSFNDYHGHLEANTAGTVDGMPAGGSEYLSAKLNQLRQGQKYSLTVAAGDLIGGSPAFSGLFHDEPLCRVAERHGAEHFRRRQS